MNSGLLDRVRDVNDKEINADGEYVLYWMISARRFNYNAALEHAANLAKEYGKPLLVVEEISTSHRFANDRITSFVIQGMVENISLFKENKIRFIPLVETPLSGPMGLLKTLCKRSVVVVTDEFPTYYPLAAITAAGKSLERRLISVDSNGVFPMSWANRPYTTAHSYRRFIHANFSRCQETWPQRNPTDKNHDYWIDDEQFN